jgi:hypothetical protein
MAFTEENHGNLRIDDLYAEKRTRYLLKQN